MFARAVRVSQRPTKWIQGYVICPTLVFSASCLLAKTDRWNSHQKNGRVSEFPHCGTLSIKIPSKAPNQVNGASITSRVVILATAAAATRHQKDNFWRSHLSQAGRYPLEQAHWNNYAVEQYWREAVDCASKWNQMIVIWVGRCRHSHSDTFEVTFKMLYSSFLDKIYFQRH